MSNGRHDLFPVANAVTRTKRPREPAVDPPEPEFELVPELDDVGFAVTTADHLPQVSVTFPCT